MSVMDHLKALTRTGKGKTVTAAAARLGRLRTQQRLRPDPTARVQQGFWQALPALLGNNQISQAQVQALNAMKRFIDNSGTKAALVLSNNSQGPVKELILYNSDITSPLNIQMLSLVWDPNRNDFI